MEILKPGHPRWVDFMVILTSPPYLDFHLPDAIGQPRPYGSHNTDDNGLFWFCQHSLSKPYGRRVLEQMTGVDADGTLAQWPDLCDCDLVFKLGNEEEEEE